MANQSDSAVVERVNELYWHSERTVTDLLAELELSRNALYNALEPLSTGQECPDCDSVLVYTNRSNRTSSRASCPDCGRVMQLTEEEAVRDIVPDPEKARQAASGASPRKTAQAAAAGSAAGKTTRESTGARSERVTPPSPGGHDVPPPASGPPRAIVIGAAAVGTLALGALITYAARRLI